MLIYDHDDAVSFISQRTQLPAEQIEKAMHATNVYQAFAGLTEEDPEMYPDVDFASLRKQHADLLPEQPGYITYPAQTTFLMRLGQLSPEMAVEFMVAETAYMAKQGIVDDDAEATYRDWARDWLAANPASN